MRHLWLAVVLALGSCGDNTSANSNSDGASASSTGACMIGFEGCGCTDDGLCLAGLACVDQMCVGNGGPVTDGVPTGTASDSASASGTATMTASTTQGPGTDSASSGTTEPAATGTTEMTTSSTGTTASSGDTSTGTTVGVSDGDTDTSSSGSGTSDSSSSSSDGTSGSTGDAAACGDGVAEAGEACDGADLDGKTCGDLGFQFGQLGCAPDCTHDASNCTNSAACGDGIIVQNVLCYEPIKEISKYTHYTALALADLDEDGHLDFIGASNLNGMKFWGGMGDGTLDPNFALSIPAVKMIPAHAVDLDKDGHLDLIGAKYGASKIQIARGDGTGNLVAHVDYDTSAGTRVALADVDSDGWLDMTTCGDPSSKVVGFRRGQPGALFGPQITYPLDLTWGAYTCGFVDFDRDGDLDLWVVRGGGPVFSVLYGDGSANFTLDPKTINFSGSNWTHAADLDGDDYIDILGVSSNNSTLNVRHGTPTWLEDMLYNFLIEGMQLQTGFAGNFDGNDILDVMVLSSNKIALEVFRGDGTGLFHDGATLVGDHVVDGAAIGDLNEDGLDDVMTIRTDNNGVGFAKIEVVLSNP